jgi:hypothetical protein
MKNSIPKLGEIIKLPKIESNYQGSLTPVYSEEHIPFKIKRIFYIYDIPKNTYRGGHAHMKLNQFLISLSGSFNVKLFDGKNYEDFLLNKPNEGLFIKKMIWSELKFSTSNSICLALASHLFDENDYIRDKLKFKKKVDA